MCFPCFKSWRKQCFLWNSTIECFSHKLKHINNAHYSGITSTQLCNTKTWCGLGTTEQTLVSSEGGREATEEGKSDLFSSFLCKKTTQFNQFSNEHLLYYYLVFVESYLCLNAENTVRISKLAFPLSLFSFACCIQKENQFIKHAIFLQKLNS